MGRGWESSEVNAGVSQHRCEWTMKDDSGSELRRGQLKGTFEPSQEAFVWS
jgi:hypothetical protein